MKQRTWARPILGLAVVTLALLACTFTVDVLPTETPVSPTATLPAFTATSVPVTFDVPSATPTLISIRVDTSSMLEIYDTLPFNDVVHGLAFTPDGSVLAAVGGNGNAAIQLYDVVSGQSLGVLEGHTNIIWGAAFSTDGQLLATVSSDKTAKIWDWRNKTLIKSLDFPGEMVSVSFSPDGQSVAFGGVAEKQNQIQYASIWTFRVGTWQPLMRYNDFINIIALAFSPKGGTLIGGGTSRNVQVWRTNDGSNVFTLSHAHQVYEAAISPDGSTVATGTCITVVNSDCTEGGIWLWDLPSGKLLMKLGGFPDAVEALGFTADGSSLLAASRDGTLRVFTTVGYAPVFQSTSPGGVEALTLSAGSGLLATGGSDKQIQLWKVVYHP
jgi:WD40 repeat protein